MKTTAIPAGRISPAATPSAAPLEHAAVRPLPERGARLPASPAWAGDPAGHDLSQVPLQTKLIVNRPGDRYEQEADQIAEKIVGDDIPLRHSAASPAQPVYAPPIVHEVLRSQGQPLDPTTRAFFEPRFGRDLRQVRLHADARATASARAVSALAYTVGHDVVLGPGQFSPATQDGRKLMAHELTHVIQQSRSPAGRPGVSAQGTPEQTAADAARGFCPLRVTDTSGVTLARTPDDETPERYPTDPGAWRGLDLLPAVENDLPGNTFVRFERHIFVSTSFARRLYRVVPQLRDQNDPHVVYYLAYNMRAERAEYAIGPDMLDNFISGATMYAIAAGNFFGFTGNVRAYEVSSYQVGSLAARGDLRGALRALGRSWLQALQDPGWWTLAITSTASALPARTPPPPRLQVIPGGGGGGAPPALRPPAPTARPVTPLPRAGGQGLPTRGATALAPQTAPAAPPRPLVGLPTNPNPVPAPQPGIISPPLAAAAGAAGRAAAPGQLPGAVPAPAPAPAPAESGRRRQRPGAYPLCWATQLYPPMFFGVGIRFFVRTPNAERDTEDAQQRRLELIYRERVDPGFVAGDYHVHHSVPLFLGGLDAAPGNLVTLPGRQHLRGHAVLRYQPQMLTPPPPLRPLPADLYSHPAGTEYELVGYKQETDEPCGTGG